MITVPGLAPRLCSGALASSSNPVSFREHSRTSLHRRRLQQRPAVSAPESVVDEVLQRIAGSGTPLAQTQRARK